MEVPIEGVSGKAQVRFDLDAAEALPSWLTLLLRLAWPAVAKTLFGIIKSWSDEGSLAAKVTVDLQPAG